MTQSRGNTTKLFDLPAGVFTPPPNVVSSLVNIDLKSGIIKSNIDDFRNCVRCAFSSRRKQLKGNIATKYNFSKSEVGNMLENMGISDMARAETLTIDQFDILTQLLSDFKK